MAREPDETLRTYLPVLAELDRRGLRCLVLFHHHPGRWALDRLRELSVPTRMVGLPPRQPSWGGLARSGLGQAVGELRQLWLTRRLAGRLLDEIQPAAVVVIQDTLLLERFLVREANRRALGTLVVQWAFTFPQALYDRLNEVRRAADAGMGRWGDGGKGGQMEGTPSPPEGERVGVRGYSPRPRVSASPCPRVPASLHLYALAQRLLGVKFDLVNSYGGGEARVFAVMGDMFREQFLAQGVRKERIEVTGHPLHDAAFAQRAVFTPERAVELKGRYDLPPEARVILYATQPVLWRRVVTREELLENVGALGRAVGALGPDFLLVLKLHPREMLEDYAPLAETGLPIRVIAQAEIAELIPPAEVFISSSSSTVLLAMMLEKPIVTVNFNQVPHFDYYENVGGTLHAKSPAAAAEALRQAVFDEPTRDRLALERAAVLARYARFDGHATERLADLVGELAG